MIRVTAQRPLAGMTLIEIMVVIVIIGILAGMVVPQLSGGGDTARLEATAQQIADSMDYCYHAAASSGRVHALLFDTVQRRIDIVAEAPPGMLPEEAPAEGMEGAAAPPPVDGMEGMAAPPEPTPAPTPAPTPEMTAMDTEAAAGIDPSAASGAEGPAPVQAVPTPVPDPAAPVSLVPVSMPGFTSRTLPEGIAVAAMETYEAELSTGVNEGQFKILFFPDGTTEFAKIDLTTPGGQRRQVWLNGVIGDVTVIDPDREGETLLTDTITDEDALAEEMAAEGEAQDPMAGQNEGTKIE